MKLLVVSNMYPSAKFPSYGVFVKNFCTQLETLKIDYTLAVMQKKQGKLGKLLAYAGFYANSFLKSLLGNYDAVYVHYASHSSPGVLLARKLRKFTVYTNVHGSDVIPENAQQEKMQGNTRVLLSLSQKIIVPSEYFKRVVAEKYGIDADKLFVCASGGVDDTLFRPLSCQTCDPRPFTMGLVGRLSSGKGWDTLLRACALLPDRNYRLLIVGDGPERGQMEQLLDELALRPYTELRGLQPQTALPEIYNEIDVFLFPTERAGESLGLVAVEAMACGTPVIASDFAAPADYVVDGVNGYKFTKASAQALADAIVKYRELSAQQQEVLRQGALETASRYTKQRVTHALEKILLE